MEVHAYWEAERSGQLLSVADIYLLISLLIGAALTELVFIDSSKDAKNLKDSSFLLQMAWRIVAALCEIYGKKPTASGSDSDKGAIGKLVVVKDNSDA